MVSTSITSRCKAPGNTILTVCTVRCSVLVVYMPWILASLSVAEIMSLSFSDLRARDRSRALTNPGVANCRVSKSSIAWRTFGFTKFSEAKAEAVRSLAEREGLDLAACAAYSDSANDIPMLSLVGQPCAINPDSKLRAHAKEHGRPPRIDPAQHLRANTDLVGSRRAIVLHGRGLGRLNAISDDDLQQGDRRLGRDRPGGRNCRPELREGSGEIGLQSRIDRARHRRAVELDVGHVLADLAVNSSHGDA